MSCVSAEGILGIAHEMKENLLDKLDLYTSTSPRKESLSGY